MKGREMDEPTIEELLCDWEMDEDRDRELIVDLLSHSPPSRTAEFLARGLIDGRISVRDEHHLDIIQGLKDREKEDGVL